MSRWIACAAVAVIVLAAPTAWAAQTPAQPPLPPQPVAVETTLPTAGDNVPQCAFDGKPDTYFESSRPVKADDTFGLVFTDPVRVKSIEIATGQPGGAGALEGGVLEISTDGKTFQQVGKFAAGAAKARPADGPIKALRLRATADGSGRLAVREITISADPAVPVFKYPIEVRLDCSEVPEMKDWCERARETVARWYPRLAEELPVERYLPPRVIDLKFRKGTQGIAGTSGNNITAFDGWFKAHPEDVGAIVHEAVHVVQSYHGRVPGWLTEGITDYVRFWIYEPSTPKRRLDPDRIRYQDSYQVTAAFLAYLVEKHDKQIVRKLNVACHNGQYKVDLFKEYAGKDLDALWSEFQDSLRRK